MEQENRDNNESLDEYIERMEKAVEVYKAGTDYWSRMMLPRAVMNLIAAKQLKDIQEDGTTK